MTENEISHSVIGAALEVHRILGVGLLESAYERAMAVELEQRGIRAVRQTLLPVTYKGVELDEAYRLDLLVEDLVIVEIKAVAAFAPVHTAQLLTYLRLANKKLGLVLNFHSESMRSGIKRVANNV
ncbi:GxxExxY protein [Panacagrimonas perspica]|uniref:GxxExxY protein n=1 Tax=Panacagrimonas perspica TaxID=381431 RepID=A0A4R7P2N0_9GAMM|nr:GxxExxY protein [Panacagrimonas perspica]TDU27983.1 GxxExxY protein [Panacagrimonas perspica]THD01250.1 GxxExxY protein [Panacagrimonas perspica]